MDFTQNPANILVIDDSIVNRKFLTRLLTLEGHRADSAGDGKEGLLKLRSQPYDLVLLDIEMPEMNGYQVLEACLGDVNLRQIPIIMTSAMDELDAVVKCVELGAEDYLNKPINKILLRARINASLEKKRLRDEQRRLFKTFTTGEVVEELLKTGFSLGGKYITASVLFADIRSFTAITESQGPSETIELLNEYFGMMFEAITNNKGSVNQIVGDGLVAFFGAPVHFADHHACAVNAGLDMIGQLKIFNARQAAQNKTQISIGIGIASGRMISGYIGTQNRASYTCVGDTINLAARIEKHTKTAMQTLLIDEHTRTQLDDSRYTIQDLGMVLFKGKQQEVNIFAVGRP